MKREIGISEAFQSLGESVANIVFSPTYYDGPWYVYCRGKRRLCRNHATAKAWAAYLQRQLGSWALNRISVGKKMEK